MIRKKLPEMPDLVMKDLTLGQEEVVQGGILDITAIIKNTGPTSSPPSDIHFYLYN